MTLALQGSEQPLSLGYDAAFVDLDGVVYVGEHAVPGAAAALEAARSAGMRVAFVTNNASRPPAAVAAHLSSLGVDAATADVVTSAQAAAAMVLEMVGAAAAVLVVGGEGLEVALVECGLRPVRSADDEPAAVVQGFAPEVGWRQLAEGTFAVRRGVPWVASNVDRTLPTARGMAPGNGTLVGVIATATGRQPVVAGKPELPLHRQAVQRTGAKHPLVVGDRLDTDIEGAHRAGTDSLLVLTGVTQPVQLLGAPDHQRPTYLGEDLEDGLLRPHPRVLQVDGGHACEGWLASRQGEHWRVSGSGRPVDGLRALCALVWDSTVGPPPDDELESLVSAVGWGRSRSV
ncbi:MAG: glycerol-phosphatase [Actinomycetota bacterium]|nr:glycerol-phosphatase [Actinomycetota bacterium]